MEKSNQTNIHSKEEKKVEEKSKLQDEAKDLDYIFDNIVGNSGWGQWSILLAQFFIRASGAMALFIPVFTTYEPLHLCLVSNCESGIDSDTSLYPLNISTSLKKVIENSVSVKQYDHCFRFNVIDSTLCLPKSHDESHLSNCKHFIYDETDLLETWTSKYDLVCDMKHWQNYLPIATTLGILTALLLGGRLCDTCGRRKTMIISMTILSPALLFGGFPPSYALWVYYCVIYILSFASTTLWISGDILTIEFFNRNQRGSVLAYNLLMDRLAKLLVIVVAYLTKDWKYIHLACGLFCLLSSGGFFFIPESVRWLSSHRKLASAEKVFHLIAKRNGKLISNTKKYEIRKILKKYVSQMDGNKIHIFRLFDFAHLSSTLALLISWLSICMARKILLNQEAFIKAKNVFQNSLHSILINELPQPIFLLIIIKLCSRRIGLFGGQLIVGVCCTILWFIGMDGNQLSITIVSVLGISFSKGMVALVCLMTIEVHPTSLRGQALGLFMALGTIGVTAMEIATPLTHSSLLICTLPVVLAAFMAYFIAETGDSKLPLSMKDSDKLNGIKSQQKATPNITNEEKRKEKSKTPNRIIDTFVYSLDQSVPFYALLECEFNELKMHSMV